MGAKSSRCRRKPSRQPSRNPSQTKSSNKIDDLKHEAITDFHIIGWTELFDRLKSNPQTGVNAATANEALARDGKNILTPIKGPNECIKFLKNFVNGFAVVLWFGAALCLASFLIEQEASPEPTYDNLYISGMIVVVILVTGFYSYAQDRSSTKIMSSFQKMVPAMATVIRNGSKQLVDVSYLVKGDIVFLKAGDKVPADIRILESKSLKVDNSSLTGETEPQPRGPQATSGNVMETQNVAFFSTSVMEGEGVGIVFETGDNTVIGRLAGLTTGLERNRSTMTREIRYFCHLITFCAVFFATIIFILSICYGNPVVQSVIYCIAIMVANVPEALLMTVTLCLTLTAKRMAKKNCVVKRLDSVETLGSTSTICSDKTGTLTQNRMTVVDISVGFTKYPINYGSRGSNAFLENANFLVLARCATLCLTAEFFSDEVKIHHRRVHGDASEAAILKCMESLVGNTKLTRAKYRKVAEIPFNSTNKYQLSIHQVDGTNLLVMKGAPERIFPLCTTMLMDGEDVPIRPDHKKRFDDMCTGFAKKGERVLGFCDRAMKEPVGTRFSTDPPNFSVSDMRFLGVMALVDPPRETVPDAVAKCKEAGIRVIMVTGDHPVTAEAIAKQVGIIDGTSQDSSMVINGDQLRNMSEDEIDEIVKSHDELVFARTTPTQKLQIVESCQRLGYITAVTGDGVNDSPALKKADIGIAMGITGSEVSKQAADMILLDDNFASIVTGIEEGRLIFDNLKKSIAYTLTSNIPEMAPFVAYILLEVPMPLSIIAILLIDVGTNLFPAISLAYEKAEADIMTRPPRNPYKDKLVNRRLIWMTYGQIGLIQTLAGFASYFVIMADYGFLPRDLFFIRKQWDNPVINNLPDSFGQEWDYQSRKVLEKMAQVSFFAAIILTQVFDLIICKTRRNSLVKQGMRNRHLNVAIIFTVALGCLFIYTPYVQTALGFWPILFIHWVPALPFGVLIILFDETRRCILRRRPGGWMERETYY